MARKVFAGDASPTLKGMSPAMSAPGYFLRAILAPKPVGVKPANGRSFAADEITQVGRRLAGTHGREPPALDRIDLAADGDALMLLGADMLGPGGLAQPAVAAGHRPGTG